ncbi:hypothetical protein M1O13_01415 [Dehalococcoidia bacterium]|nr:hypothetical protein [Dehalococcoidia bacterium]
MRCAKQTVVDAERWFVSCPQAEVLALVDDQRIKRLVGREFPDMELTPNQLIKAGQVTGDDILLHYGRIHPHGNKAAKEIPSLDEAERVAGVHPIYIKLLQRHWDRLCEQAVTFRTQLSPPDIETLFAAEVCHKVHNAFQNVSPLLSYYSWKKVIDAPLALKLSDSVEGKTVEVRLSVEEEFLFSHLTSHLEAEFSEFTQFGSWKGQLGHLIHTCLQATERVARNCSSASGMYYLGGSRQKGLSWDFPAYVCQFILKHLNSGAVPKLRVVPQPDGLWKLVPEELPTLTLAVDTGEHIHRCQEVLVKEIRNDFELEVGRRIDRRLAELRVKANHLQAMLTAAIERGSFEGTCSLCEGYFSRSSHTA